MAGNTQRRKTGDGQKRAKVGTGSDSGTRNKKSTGLVTGRKQSTRSTKRG